MAGPSRHSVRLARSASQLPGLITDVCVPISRLAECILETRQDNATAPFPISLVGHVGDGNFHLIYLLNMADPSEPAAAGQLNERLVMRALRLGGTVPASTVSASAR